jgi:hypothetical protein
MFGQSKWVWLMLAPLWPGCLSATTSNTARTSTEQLLVANAVDQALDKIDFTSFADARVFLQDKFVDCVDKNYVIASTRHRLLNAGAYLVDAADKADVIVELRNGAVGTTSANSFVGTPQVMLPGMMSIPEIRLIERRRQEGTAKLGLVAYDAHTNQILGQGGLSLARADDSNWFVAGVGPYQNGTVKAEVTRSTRGPAAKSHGQLPPVVAFTPPLLQETPQYAAEEPPAQDVTPAGHTDDSQPAWAR